MRVGLPVWAPLSLGRALWVSLHLERVFEKSRSFRISLMFLISPYFIRLFFFFSLLSPPSEPPVFLLFPTCAFFDELGCSFLARHVAFAKSAGAPTLGFLRRLSYFAWRLLGCILCTPLSVAHVGFPGLACCSAMAQVHFFMCKILQQELITPKSWSHQGTALEPVGCGP